MNLFRSLPDDRKVELLDVIYNTGSQVVKNKYLAKGGRRPRKSFTELPKDSQTRRIHVVIGLLKKMLMDKNSPHMDTSVVYVLSFTFFPSIIDLWVLRPRFLTKRRA